MQPSTDMLPVVDSFTKELRADVDTTGLPWEARHLADDIFDAGNKAISITASAKERANAILADPTLDRTYAATQAAQVRQQAAEQAEALVAAADLKARRLQNHLQDNMRPAKPAGISQAEILDRKADLQLQLGTQNVGHKATELFQQAKRIVLDPAATERQKDDARLSMHVLAGGALDAFYGAHDPNTNLLLAQHLGSEGMREFFKRRMQGGAAGGRNFNGYLALIKHATARGR